MEAFPASVSPRTKNVRHIALALLLHVSRYREVLMRVETLFSSGLVVPLSEHITLNRMKNVVNAKEGLTSDEFEHLSRCRACLELIRLAVREGLESAGTPLIL